MSEDVIERLRNSLTVPYGTLQLIKESIENGKPYTQTELADLVTRALESFDKALNLLTELGRKRDQGNV